MTCVYVIQTGRTTWDELQRVESATGAPLTEQGIQAVQDTARELAASNIGGIYACQLGQAERQAADLAAEALGGAKIHSASDLHELDYGLWQGLTIDEIKHRQSKSYRQWLKSPASICPPQGETPAAAQQRLAKQLRRIVKRNRSTPILLVLRPVIAGLLKCLIQDQPVDELWSQVDSSLSWTCYDIDDSILRGKSK